MGSRPNGLLRLACNDVMRFLLRPNSPTGKSPEVCPVLRAKIFRLTRRANQRHYFARLTADEGRVAIVTNVRWDAVDARGAQDEGARRVRRSRVVLTPRCWRQVAQKYLRGDGGKRAVHRYLMHTSLLRRLPETDSMVG